MKKASFSKRPRGFRHADESNSKVESAMREVHTNIPSTVKRAKKFGPKGREGMLRAVAFSKARKRK